MDDSARGFEAYLECLAWSAGEEYDGSYFSDAATLRAREEWDDFWEQAADLVFDEPTGSPEQAGHDFALTRNRHGAGFWDGDWPVHGQALTEIAHAAGEAELYLSDEGEIEIY